ncbi:NAD(P)-binding domain-containing protein [Desulfovermiculus halophilus]|uniref:NAD(P)-binding domain-containing protein n=1 Tax=Desulfovermiculus halophilus TaxID=339722 RepID=UPI000482F499|nr:NAD(P)-binding domain-containing protein [Desulfovermiculus halophilus]
MTMRLVGIGGLGLMLSPAARHLSGSDSAQFVRIHDRGTRDERRERCRKAWSDHGAELVQDLEAVIGDGNLDGVVICAGKNGDDCRILRTLAPIIQQRCDPLPFVLHLSTVSSSFALSAHSFLQEQGIAYVNYPLTGGPAGAEAATMLILASGDPALYKRLEPILQQLGNPQFFGERVTAGAEVKLIGQLMVFNGLTGICSGAALKSECFQEPLTGQSQAQFFDFLNNGAGGTRQWDVALSKGVRDNTWDQGFMLQHAAVDAIYAAHLCLEQGLSSLTVMPMLCTALSFAFVLDKHQGAPLATHAVVRELVAGNAPDIDGFVQDKLDFSSPEKSLYAAINALPSWIQDSVLLDVDTSSFV